MTPGETVSAFGDAVSRSARDEATVARAADCVYHNIPMPLVEGAAGGRATLVGLIQLLGSLRLDSVRQVAPGEWVMNERLDHFDPPTARPYSLPVAGSLRVQNGRITLWNDYFDVQPFSTGTGINL